MKAENLLRQEEEKKFPLQRKSSPQIMFKINDAHEINEEFICSTKEKEQTLPLLKRQKGWKGVSERESLQGRCHEKLFLTKAFFLLTLFTHIHSSS